MRGLKGKIEEKANKAISDKLLELEKSNAEAIKLKIDDFALKARIWIKEEVKEAFEKERKNVKKARG